MQMTLLFVVELFFNIFEWVASVIEATQPAITYSKLTTKAPEQGVKYVQS